MSETKFRPGPWKVEPGDGGYGVKGFSHWSIAQVAKPRFTLAITIGDVSELAAQEIANARLIAAAPELYADALDTEHAYSWLMQVVAEHKQERDSMTAVQINSFLDNLIAYCESHQIGTRAALAKAGRA